MIEKMQMVHIVTSISKKDEMLEALRKVGVVHIAEKKSADRDIIDRVQNLTKTASTLKEYVPDKKKKGKVSVEILSDEKFAEVYSEVLNALDTKAQAIQDMGAASTEIDRINAWGDFSPSEVKKLKEEGFDFHFYRIGKKEMELALSDPEIRLIRLNPIDKMDAIAVLGTLPAEIPATEFNLPDKSISDYKKIISDCNQAIADADEILTKDSVYGDSFNEQILKAQEEETFSSASATVESDDAFVWISGYVPAVDADKVKQMASQNNCAWAVEEVADDDEQIPTKVRYNKVSKLIEPVFDLLGILPGYREQDISLWFFLFFVLFFAMIIGDAGYGFLILGGTLALMPKLKKSNGTLLFLLMVLSIATIIWGTITGTWFGLEAAMDVPFLKALVIPNFANYPEYFGVTATAQQNTIMKFSFSIGAIQMALGSLLCIKKKISEKNLSWVADLGWMIAIIAMYLLSLNLVIGDDVPIVAVFVAIGVAFLLVVVFGGMSPEKTFGQGLKSGVADAFTVFLNTISCFGNVMSYIRLFAVGMAGLAIAQSFNQIAAGFEGVLVVAGIVVVLIGHGLNLVMAFLSVVVHGVRLNVLEFSGQVGLEWTGIPYEPFKETVKENNSEKEN